MHPVGWIRSLVYDAAIVGLTAAWYQTVLERLPPDCRLLDIGIGTGSALIANAEIVTSKRLRITGVDVDSAYVERCNREISRTRLHDHVEVRLESIYDHRGGPYDAAYFSASFMLLPDPPRALRQVCSLLLPGGRIYFTQTFEHRRSRAVEVLKPLLRLATTIDFGRVTYEADFRHALAQGGVELEELAPLSTGQRRSAVLAVAQPAVAQSGGM